MPKIGRFAVVVAGLFIVYAVVMVNGWPSRQTATKMDALASVVVPALAVVFAVRAALTSHGRLRAAWWVLTLGLVSATIAETIWAYYKVVLHTSKSPSPADAAYLLFPVLTLAALLLLAGGRRRQSQIRLLLDGVIMGASLLIVSWLTVMAPVYAKNPTATPEMLVALAYPVSHAVTLTVAALALAQKAQVPLTPLALGLACMTLAESAYAYISAGSYIATHHLINVGWMAGMVLIMFATANGNATAADHDEGEEMPGWASVLLPYAPLMLAVTVLAFQPPSATSPMVLITGAVLIVAVLARQLLVVAENRRLLATVADRAMRDPLTGLANRALFQDRLEHAIALRERDNQSVGVLILDLNDFKLVNDTMGHPAGDELLKDCGTRLPACTRTGDTVARLGGDEFAVLFEGRLEQWLPAAHRVVDAFDRPFIIDGYELMIRPSAGLAVAGGSDIEDMSAEELLKRADTAMYYAKRSGGRGVYIYTAEMASHGAPDAESPDRESLAESTVPARGAAVVQFLGQLRQAIDRRELFLVYQPTVDSRTRRIVGVEALLRWPHPERGLLGPEEFLPLVRQYGLMDAVTDLVVDTALQDAAQWHAAGAQTPVAVNLFAPLLGDLDLPGRLSQALAAHGLGTDALTVEITEDQFLEDIDRTRTVLRELRERGIRVAVDDFGSGYSALAYLSDLPIDEVKLDRELIAPALVDRRAAVVLTSVIDLAHRLGLVVVAEGIESAEIASRIAEFDCDVLQGYYFGAPVTAAELLPMLAADSVSSEVGSLERTHLS